MQDIDFWKLSDELTIVQAALLVIGVNPDDHPFVESGNLADRPRGYEAAKHAIFTSLKAERIRGEIKYFVDERGDYDPYPSDTDSTVEVASLKQWLKGKGMTQHFFFFPESAVSEFMDTEHPRYSRKLAAVVAAWQAMDNPDRLRSKTVKQAVEKWLRENASQYGLLNEDDGSPQESVIKQLAKIVNWQTEGGAPKTASAENEMKILPKPDGILSVKAPASSPAKTSSTFDLDEEIPF